MDFKAWRKHYYPALERLGLRSLPPHRCRHTFTTLAMHGAKNAAIQKLAGHTDYAFTANNYTHLEIENLREEIEKI